MNADEREAVKALIARLHSVLRMDPPPSLLERAPISIQEMSDLLEYMRVLDKHWSAATEALKESRVRVKELEEEAHVMVTRIIEAEDRAEASESYRSEVGWSDEKDEWSELIKEAHPIHTGAHAEYEIASRMVGHRRSKVSLVELVNWLLVRSLVISGQRDVAEARATAADVRRTQLVGEVALLRVRATALRNSLDMERGVD